mgnify:CR=1 FL=1
MMKRTVEKQKRQKLPTTAAEVKQNTSRNFLVFTLNLEQRYEKKTLLLPFIIYNSNIKYFFRL